MPVKPKGSRGVKFYTTPWKVQKESKDSGRGMPITSDGMLYSVMREYRVHDIGNVEVAWVTPDKETREWMAILSNPSSTVAVDRLIPVED